MKTKMSLGDRTNIIKMVMENRVEYAANHSSWVISSCPFDNGCLTCISIFPKWGKVSRGGAHKCPCGSMGTSYVKRRMKLLFPELY